MKEIICNAKQEFDALPKSFSEYTVIHIKFSEYCNVEAWGNSHVVAWENSRVEARGNSHVVAWGNSHVVAWGNSRVEAWGNNSVKNYSKNTEIVLMFYSVCWMFEKCKKLTKSETSTIIDSNHENSVDKFLELHGISAKTKTVKLFKRVSKDLGTQEGLKNKTIWSIGSSLTVQNWNPILECGEGKFHACPKTFFCDEFRDTKDDRYVLIEVKKEDLYAHKNPTYPHKIAFKTGKVICEVDRDGTPIKA